MSRKLHLLAVAAAAALLLGIGIQSADIATPFTDPVLRIRAQDESSYANIAVHLATDGSWLTPRVLGRYVLYKPPLLVWLAGLSLKLFGVSLWALRLPALAAGIAASCTAFWRMTRGRTVVAGWLAVALLLANPMWHIFARLCHTDMLLAASITGSMAFLYADPRLSRRNAFWGFAICVAAGIMVKNIAGALPLAVLVLFAIFSRQEQKPSLARIALACAAITALVAPWHVYQLIVHPKWFWADYVQVQLLGFGLKPPHQTTGETQAGFYLRRLLLMDPVLLLLTAAALPSLILAVRRRESAEPLLVASWLAVISGALLLFRFRNLPYALYLLPPCALVVAGFGPFAARRAKFGLGLVCAALVVKSLYPAQLWGLSFGRSEPLAATAVLRSYAMQNRPNELILADGDDSFYATALPLPGVRYYFFDPGRLAVAAAPHYEHLGIIVSVDEFEHLDQLRPVYAERLRDWGLDSTAPVATTIVSSARDVIARLIRARPLADFYLPASDADSVEGTFTDTHRKVLLSNGRALMLAREAPKEYSPPASWHLPDRW